MKCVPSSTLQIATVVIVTRRIPEARSAFQRATMSMPVAVEKCRRHKLVEGDGGKTNDVVVCGDLSTSKSHVIFFGGDVQDYPEIMSSHRDNYRYSDWNLENTAVRLRLRKFKDSTIFVVKPMRMHLNTFSVFSNFVDNCNDFGSPSHHDTCKSWQHLENVYRNVVDKELQGCSSGGDACINVPVKLIGFSKGCIVLNQLLHDLPGAQEDSGMKSFIDKIEEFYWLDGGHSGGRNTWVTDSDVLQNFSELGKKIIVHVTPYQVKDPMRAWVGKEEKKFVSKLRKFGADITEMLHFDDLPACIENHFGVLEEF